MGLIDLHNLGWIVMTVLFFINLSLIRRSKEKGEKIVSIILRIFYIITLGTGATMLVQYNFPTTFAIKGLIAVLLVGIMEMIVGRTKRQQKSAPFWIIYIVLLVLVLLVGMKVISF